MVNDNRLTRDDFVGTLFGAAAFQVLNAGNELGLFKLLNERPELTGDEISAALGLARRPVDVLLLGSTALKLTTMRDGRYRNAELIDTMFATEEWEIITDLVTFEANFVYAPQGDLVESLRQNTNVGLRHFDGDATDLYHRLPNTPHLEQLFYQCMRSWSRLSNPILVAKADLTGVRRVLDVGGGDGVNAIELAKVNQDTEFTVLDLPGAVAIAKKKIADNGLTDRIEVAEGDIFADTYPKGYDAVLFANQLVIWSPEENLSLLRKAYDALDDGGRVLIFNVMSDDTGDGPLYAALDNLYFTTITAGGSNIYPWGQYERWLTEVGFTKVERLPGDTWTPHGVIAGTK